MPPEHHTSSSGWAPRWWARLQRLRSSASAAANPKPCRLEGLAQTSGAAAAIAASAAWLGGVVAQVSRYWAKSHGPSDPPLAAAVAGAMPLTGPTAIAGQATQQPVF